MNESNHIHYAGNCNKYIVRGHATEKTIKSIYNRDRGRLSWSDFSYVHPAAYLGSDPRTLDELCVFYQQLRMHRQVFQEEKDFVLERFAELMFEEAGRLSDILEMPFTSLHLYCGSLKRMASTNCSGSISFNSRFLFDDADTIREALVHELCHSQERGHGLRFSEIMEQSMMICKLIPRPCAYSPHLSMPNGARFPVGNNCPGYNFRKGIKGESPQDIYLGTRSITIKRTP